MLTIKSIFLSTVVLLFTLNEFIICVRDRVVGGETSPKHYKYQISLQVKRKSGTVTQWLHNCGGSIISQSYVITAAHCVKGGKPEILSVVAGTSDLSKKGFRHLIENFIIHPDYVELKTSDIAIMKVKSPFTFSDMVGPIKISTRHVDGNVKTMLTGWGYTFPIRIGAPPKKLQRAEFTTLSNKECKKRGLKPTPTEICAFKKFLVGACGGDSGGPLVTNGELIGVVSYGTVICGSGVPDVYTRVSVFYDWIQQNTLFSANDPDEVSEHEEVDPVDESGKNYSEEDAESIDDFKDSQSIFGAQGHDTFQDKLSSNYLLKGTDLVDYDKSYPLYFSKDSSTFDDEDFPISFYESDGFR